MEQSQNLSSFRRAFVILCCAACALWVANFLCYSIPYNVALPEWVETLRSVFNWIGLILGMVMPICFVALFFLNMKITPASAAKVAFIVGVLYAVLASSLRIWWIIYELLGGFEYFYEILHWDPEVIYCFINLLLIISVAFFAESQIKNKLVVSTSVVYMLCSFVWAIASSFLLWYLTGVIADLIGFGDRSNIDYIVYRVVCVILNLLPTILLFAAATTIVKKQKTINKA
jgi:hypothetical protein